MTSFWVFVLFGVKTNLVLLFSSIGFTSSAIVPLRSVSFLADLLFELSCSTTSFGS